MYVIKTDLAPGLVGLWAHEERCHLYADKLRAAGYSAEVLHCDTPNPIIPKLPSYHRRSLRVKP